jgi:hypothetical protein
MKPFHNKTVYLNDIVQYDYTTPLAVKLQIFRAKEQSDMNFKNPNSKNYFNLKPFRKDKK